MHILNRQFGIIPGMHKKLFFDESFESIITSLQPPYKSRQEAEFETENK